MIESDTGRSAGVTPVMCGYLMAIDFLRESRVPVTTRRLASRLNVSCPAVTNMIKRLHERGLVTHAPYRGVTPTDAGMAIAATVIRRRHVLERYFVENLGYTGEEARVEASRLDCVVTAALEAHIEAALHGAARPTVPHRIFRGGTADLVKDGDQCPT